MPSVRRDDMSLPDSGHGRAAPPQAVGTVAQGQTPPPQAPAAMRERTWPKNSKGAAPGSDKTPTVSCAPRRPARKTKGTRDRSPCKTRLMRELASGKNATNKAAAIAAGYSPHSASTSASKVLADPQFRAELQALMDRVGATRLKVLTRLNEGLDATRKTYAIADGKITDERSDPDYEG